MRCINWKLSASLAVCLAIGTSWALAAGVTTPPANPAVTSVESIYTGITTSHSYQTTELCATNGIIDRISSTVTRLLVDTALTCTSSKVSPITLTIEFIGQGGVTISTGVTWTAEGEVIAPLRKVFTLTGTGLVSMSLNREVYAEWWGAVNDGTTNSATAIQAALDATYTDKVLLGPGSYRIDTAITLPSNRWLIGTDPAGGFGTILRPHNVAAIVVDNVHHSIVENLMIWPTATTSSPPASYITVGLSNYSYSIAFRDIRLHFDVVGTEETDSCIHVDNSNDVVFDRVIIRADGGTNHLIGYRFDPQDGSAVIRGGTVENSSVGIKHLGGHVMVSDLYTEGGGQPIWLEGGADSSFSMYGGYINGTNSGPPISIKDGAQNVVISGSYVWRPDETSQGWVYGLSGSSNITIDIANYDPAQWGTSVTVPPTVVTFPHLVPPSKFTSINVTTGTLAAGDITGAKFVSLMSTNATPGTQTTRTATQMVADHLSGVSTTSYTLRITNSGAGTFTLAAGTGVTLTGTMTIATNTWREFVVTITATATPAITIQSIAIGTYS